MHKLPFWGAVGLLVLLIFIAIRGNTSEYSINQDKIWTIIGINFILILIPVIKEIFRSKENQ